MAQRFIVMKYKSILPTCMIPEPGDPMGADSYAYTSLKYTYTSLKYAGVVAEPPAARHHHTHANQLPSNALLWTDTTPRLRRGHAGRPLLRAFASAQRLLCVSALGVAAHPLLLPRRKRAQLQRAGDLGPASNARAREACRFFRRFASSRVAISICART